MKSWDALPSTPLKTGGGDITAAFLAEQQIDYRGAARFVRQLAYGRNQSAAQLAVLEERKGTCSTKHALLARLALEQRLAVTLRIGIYEMSEANTPGVGWVLSRHGLRSIPEAHCYLYYRGHRIDITRAADGAEPIAGFLHEQTVAPEQIGEYKIGLHRRFMREWLEKNPELRGRTMDQFWTIREQCIAALSGT